MIDMWQINLQQVENDEELKTTKGDLGGGLKVDEIVVGEVLLEVFSPLF